MLDAAASTIGGDPRETEPGRVVRLLEGTPLLLISGDADSTVPPADARRLAAAAPSGTVHRIVPGAGHGRAHATDPVGYEAVVTDHLRRVFTSSRGARPIIASPGRSSASRSHPVSSVED
jgi:pimeloyl-ACP methyl ester carboxylesterase